jgi:hypothetical protein
MDFILEIGVLCALSLKDNKNKMFGLSKHNLIVSFSKSTRLSKQSWQELWRGLNYFFYLHNFYLTNARRFLSVSVKMESLSNVVRVHLPGYLRDLPVPNTFFGWFSLGLGDWAKLVNIKHLWKTRTWGCNVCHAMSMR